MPVRLNPKGNLAKLINKLETLNKKEVELGYFAEQPNHTTGDSYGQIMAYHELGSALVVPQPVLGSLSRHIRSTSSNPSTVMALELKKLIKHTNYSVSNVLDSIGNTYAHYTYQNIFGSSPPLEIVNNPTPMVDTGELSENFAWRTTLEMQYKTVGG